jgi:hypothetical protein
VLIAAAPMCALFAAPMCALFAAPMCALFAAYIYFGENNKKN